MSKNVEDLLVFIVGAIPSTAVAYTLLDHVILPMLLATMTGFVGGGAAILGKFFVNYLLKKLKK
jgi:hypothetical protein